MTDSNPRPLPQKSGVPPMTRVIILNETKETVSRHMILGLKSMKVLDSGY